MRSRTRNRWSLQAPATATCRSHLLVGSGSPTTYTLTVEVGGLEVDLFREWFHYVPGEKTWYPDALVPVTSPCESGHPGHR